MADFQALQQKYAPVVDVIKKFEPYGAKFVGSQLVGEQYQLVAHVPSQAVLERAWDEIKKIDPQYADLKHEIINTGGQEDHYTLQVVDNLSKVSLLYYGNANSTRQSPKPAAWLTPTRRRLAKSLPFLF